MDNITGLWYLRYYWRDPSDHETEKEEIHLNAQLTMSDYTVALAEGWKLWRETMAHRKEAWNPEVIFRIPLDSE